MKENGAPNFRTATLTEQVYEHLLRQICTGSIPAAAPLREMDLVAELGVSRTPIREALLRLVEYGLVEFSGRSARVRVLGEQDVVHIYQVRKALEGEAVRLACGRFSDADFACLDSLIPSADLKESPANFDAACVELDMQLHRMIALRSGNPILVQAIRKLHDLIQLLHKAVADRGQLLRELREHRGIIAALKSGDRSASRKALLGHLRAACRSQVRCLQAGDSGRAADPLPSVSSIS